MFEISDPPSSQPLLGKRVAFAGKLGGVTKREAQQLVRRHGGIATESFDASVDVIVIGADHLPLGVEDLLDESALQAAAENRLEIITETQFWEVLGLVENEQHVRRLYTPAMLADLLDVPIGIIRRWHRRGLIVPAREVHRLPYFDFQEVATARRLAQLLAAGASPAAIEQKLEQLARVVPNVERPLAQLSVIIEGRQLLLRQGDGLIESGGQLRFDFDSSPDEPSETEPPELGEHVARIDRSPVNVDSPAVLPMDASQIAANELPATPHDMLEYATELEDDGLLEAAIEVYRALLVGAGPDAEICFRLAELLYRVGDVSAARERYYMSIECDEEFVEARANLGCVLAETGQLDLAMAAFQGALLHHPNFPDVHYHLARTLDELDREDDATVHWREFLALAPDSPWAEEARQHLNLPVT
jgi:tetratricopeptide (TPR) repeat protein